MYIVVYNLACEIHELVPATTAATAGMCSSVRLRPAQSASVMMQSALRDSARCLCKIESSTSIGSRVAVSRANGSRCGTEAAGTTEPTSRAGMAVDGSSPRNPKLG